MPTIRRRVVVTGRVQGVFYRAACRAHAEGLGVSGWARNLADGRVEVVVEGEVSAVDALVRWCGKGPPRALVTSVAVTAEEPEGLRGFGTR